jgi:hypothetical protein
MNAASSVDPEHQRADKQDRAEDVGTSPEADSVIALDQPDGQERGRDADRDVDEEDPVPVDRLGEDAAGKQPDRGPGGGDEAVHADRPRLLPRLREHRHDHAQDDGGRHRSPDALDEPRPDQKPLALSQPAEQRG